MAFSEVLLLLFAPKKMWWWYPAHCSLHFVLLSSQHFSNMLISLFSHLICGLSAILIMSQWSLYNHVAYFKFSSALYAFMHFSTDKSALLEMDLLPTNYVLVKSGINQTVHCNISENSLAMCLLLSNWKKLWHKENHMQKHIRLLCILEKWHFLISFMQKINSDFWNLYD